MSQQIPLEAAVRALQQMFEAFTGRKLPTPNAKMLIEQIPTEPTNENKA